MPKVFLQDIELAKASDIPDVYDKAHIDALEAKLSIPNVKLHDFSLTLGNINIPSIAADVTNTSLPSIDIEISDALSETWAVASLAKYEVYNGSTRINVTPVCVFSMNGQKTLRVRMMATGPNAQTATKITGAILLTKR